MRRVVVIGDSAAGFSAIQSIISQGAQLQLTVISSAPHPPCNKALFLDLLSGKIAEKDIFLCAQDFYSRHGVESHKPAQVSRLDTKRQKVVLKDNTKIDYEYLIIASGSEFELPDIQGTGKDGVFAFGTLEGVRQIRQRLELSPVACLVGGSEECLALSKAMHKAREIKIISARKPEGLISDEHAEWIEEAGLSEIIAEASELKAVKLSSGKVIGTELVVFAGERKPRSAFLKDSGVTTDEKGYILVDQSMRTNVANIFSCGSVCREQGETGRIIVWESAWAEGAQAAASVISLQRGMPLCQQTS